MSQIHSAESAWQVRLAPEATVEFELSPPTRIWGLAGKAIETVEIWMKAVAGNMDLRVRIERTENGLAVSIDRGEDPDGHWWAAEAAPRLLVSMRPDGVREVQAIIGSADSGTGDPGAKLTAYVAGHIQMP